MIKELLEKLDAAKIALDDAEQDVNLALSTFAETANTEFYMAGHRVSERYGYTYATTIYDEVPFSHYHEHKFHLNNDESFKANFSYTDRDGEIFNWTLILPYNPDKLLEYVKNFEQKLIDTVENRVKANKDAAESKRREQYEKLKAEFGD